MKLRLFFFLLSIFTLLLFTFYSYSVAKEQWLQKDFNTTVKLQDHVSRRFDKYFSYFSFLGSAEVTVGFCLIMAILALIRFKVFTFLAWLMIVPASMGEVFGKLVLFHPAPPIFLHRTTLFTNLPSFYVHTDFSYPSGHMTRTIFILTILLCMSIFQLKSNIAKLLIIPSLAVLALLMGLTRVYLGEHWTSDVIGGALLGAGVGFFASGLILRVQKV